jgi:Rieske Fe-S protein
MTITGTVNSGAGSITGMTSTQAAASYSDSAKTFHFFTDGGNGDYGKMAHADLLLYKFSDDNTADEDYVTIAANAAVSGASGTIYVPSENGTFLTTATSYATSAINIATSASNYPINLKPHGTGHVVVGNAGATGKVTSNGAYDLVIDTNSGTNAGNITLTDGVDGNIDITPNGSGEVNISKVDIDGGTLGGITIDGNWTAASQTCANLGTVTTADINGGTWQGTIDGSWTAASQTCANLGTVTTADINGGTIDGTAIGSYSAAAGTFTGLDVSEGNIVNVGEITCDQVASDVDVVGLQINFGGNTTLNTLVLRDNLADALNIIQGGTSYMQFVTTDSGEKIVAGKDLETSTTTKIKQKGAFMQSSTHQALTLGY